MELFQGLHSNVSLQGLTDKYQTSAEVPQSDENTLTQHDTELILTLTS